MVGLGVVLLVLAVVAVVVGLAFYGNGKGEVPEQPMRDTAATRRGISRISWPKLFASMKTSVKDATRSEADEDQRRTAMGAFLVLVGVILVVLAILFFIAAML
jgi:hypothetical protein